MEAVAAMGVWASRRRWIAWTASISARQSRATLGRAGSGAAPDAGVGGDAARRCEIALAEAAGRLERRRGPRRCSSRSCGATRRSDVAGGGSLHALQALKVPNMDEMMKVAVADATPTSGARPSASCRRCR